MWKNPHARLGDCDSARGMGGILHVTQRESVCVCVCVRCSAVRNCGKREPVFLGHTSLLRPCRCFLRLDLFLFSNYAPSCSGKLWAKNWVWNYKNNLVSAKITLKCLTRKKEMNAHDYIKKNVSVKHVLVITCTGFYVDGICNSINLQIILISVVFQLKKLVRWEDQIYIFMLKYFKFNLHLNSCLLN